MEFLTRPITSDRREEKGQSIYKSAKILMFIGLCGLAFMLLICIICLAMGGDFVDPITFSIRDGDFAWAYLFVGIAYLAILLGIVSVPMYFSGLNIYALGRIAHNTEKE